MREALEHGTTLALLLPLLWHWLSSSKSSLGSLLRLGRRPLVPRSRGVAATEVMPLPFRPCSGAPTGEVILTNLWVGFLNLAHSPCTKRHFCGMVPSAAQRRLLEHLSLQAAALLKRTAGMAMGELENLRSYLRTGDSNYGTKLSVLPLSGRCGVPQHAASVETAKVLSEHFPSLAGKAEDPALMLGRSPAFVVEPPKITCLLNSDYRQYVEKGVAAGLFELQSPSQVPMVSGVPIVSGAFAVAKDAFEDRPIAPLERLNSLVSDSTLEGLDLPYLPQLITVDVPKDAKIKIYVSKRDARHYYPSLSVSDSWKRWLAMPPVKINGSLVHPIHCTWPMGFRGSCMFAQGVTETVCLRASLPVSCRLLPIGPHPGPVAGVGSDPRRRVVPSFQPGQRCQQGCRHMARWSRSRVGPDWGGQPPQEENRQRPGHRSPGSFRGQCCPHPQPLPSEDAGYVGRWSLGMYALLPESAFFGATRWQAWFQSLFQTSFTWQPRSRFSVP